MRGVFTIAVLFAGSLALPTVEHVVHEKRDAASTHARQRLDPDAIVPIRIGLRQNNLDTGYDRLMDVSHPASGNYGKHLSAEDVHDIFAPTEETVSAVKDWLLSSGLDESDIMHYHNKGWLAIDVPAHHAERLLNTEYYEYETSQGYRIGCDAYSLPAHISRDHVDLIKPGVKLSAPLRKRTVKRDGPGWPSPGWPSPGWHHHPPPHEPIHHWPHWQPPPGMPPALSACSVNIT
jgi:tripeptidyl-peptidase-1